MTNKTLKKHSHALKLYFLVKLYLQNMLVKNSNIVLVSLYLFWCGK